MRAVMINMGKRKVAVGAFNIILTLFILLLLQFLSQCLSSSTLDDDDEILNAFSAKRTTSSVNNLMQEIAARQRWPRRMLGSMHSSDAFNVPWHHANYRQLLEGKNTGPKHGSSTGISTTDMAVSRGNPEKVYPGGEVKPQSDHQDCSSSSTAHRAGNSSTIDPRYGVEKRLVPTGPNPLHN